MDQENRKKQLEWQNLLDELDRANITEAEKIIRAFDFIVGQHLEHGQREIELARAMQDQESVIREQIKMETLKYANNRLQELHSVFQRRRPA